MKSLFQAIIDETDKTNSTISIYLQNGIGFNAKLTDLKNESLLVAKIDFTHTVVNVNEINSISIYNKELVDKLIPIIDEKLKRDSFTKLNNKAFDLFLNEKAKQGSDLSVFCLNKIKLTGRILGWSDDFIFLYAKRMQRNAYSSQISLININSIASITT